MINYFEGVDVIRLLLEGVDVLELLLEESKIIVG